MRNAQERRSTSAHRRLSRRHPTTIIETAVRWSGVHPTPVTCLQLRASSASVATANLGCPSALWPTLIGMKVHTFCAFWPRLGDIMGARHRPYGRGILAVCPSLIGLGSYCEPRMPIGVVATLIGIKVDTFCALSPRLGGIMGARHRPYGRAILAVGPGLLANWYLHFL